MKKGHAMDYQHISVSIENKVCLISLNRPDVHNALVVEMRGELIQQFKAIQEDPGIRAVVLTGEGKSFSAGGDLKSLKSVDAILGRERLKVGHELIRAILNVEKPVIAAVNGVAAGAGFSLALACDIIYAAQSAVFIQSFAKVGLIPDLGGIHFLAQQIGPYRAKELMFTGGQISAEEAHGLGIVNRVLKQEDLLQEAFALGLRMAHGPGISIGLTKKLLNRNIHAELDETLELEALSQGVCFGTEDFQEGVQAFFEKRSPQFRGK